MNKTLIVIGREFNSRVRKKSFLVTTILVPVFIAAIYAFMIWMMMRDDTETRTVAVYNASEIEAPLQDIGNTSILYVTEDVPNTEYRAYLDRNSYNALIKIPSNIMEVPVFEIFASKQIPMDLKDSFEGQLKSKIETIKRENVLNKYDVPDLEKELASTKTDVSLKTYVTSESGKAKESSSEVISILGMAGGFLIFIFIMSYASAVMSGVMQEKSSRIMEVIVSTIKPFNFLMGKVIGVAAVGLVQFLIWIVLGVGIISIVQGSMITPDNIENVQQAGEAMMANQGMNIDTNEIGGIMTDITSTLSLTLLLKFFGAFVFYFIGGYLIFSSIFAAIGSAVDNETESNQFLTPITLLMLVGFYIGFGAMRSPDSALSVWGSIIPFTSPFVMLVRIPFGVPTWEFALSACLLVITFVGMIWVSSKIYRVGILTHGSKVTWGDLFRWLRY